MIFVKRLSSGENKHHRPSIRPGLSSRFFVKKDLGVTIARAATVFRDITFGTAVDWFDFLGISFFIVRNQVFVSPSNYKVLYKKEGSRFDTTLVKRKDRIMKNIFDIKMLRFLIVGIINTSVGIFIMFFLYNVINASYWIASATNYILTSILSFFLNKYFTFKDASKTMKSVGRFIINICICYFLAYGIAKPLAFKFLAEYSPRIIESIAMLVGMIFFTGFNYIGQRYFVFWNSEKH